MDTAKNISIPMEEIMPLLKEQLAMGNSVTFFPNGTSMLPMLRQGLDSVTLSPAPSRLKKYDLPLYQRKNGQYVLHRIIQAGDTYTCMGDNQFLPEKGIAHGQIIAVVTEFQRGSHKYTADNRIYKSYCRFWHYSRPLRHMYRTIRSFLS